MVLLRGQLSTCCVHPQQKLMLCQRLLKLPTVTLKWVCLTLNMVPACKWVKKLPVTDLISALISADRRWSHVYFVLRGILSVDGFDPGMMPLHPSFSPLEPPDTLHNTGVQEGTVGLCPFIASACLCISSGYRPGCHCEPRWLPVVPRLLSWPHRLLTQTYGPLEHRPIYFGVSILEKKSSSANDLLWWMTAVM